MGSFIEFLIVVAWYVAVYRAIGWVSRRKAEHRARYIREGMKENNPGRRLRGQSYARLFSLVYGVMGGLLFFIISSAIGRSMAPLPAFLMATFVPAQLALIPAGFVAAAYAFYSEAVHPEGDLSLAVRDKQMHVPGQPIVPNGEFGSAQILDAMKAGLSNPMAFFTKRQPIVDEVAK